MNLTNPIFTDKDVARAYLEAQRWPDGAICPHCGGTDKNTKLEGKAHRPGLYQCGDCRQQFTVTVGTVFERSKVPLNKWLLATHLMASSKKGISAHQLHRSIGVTYKTAWFMFHRVREAMRNDDPVSFGSGGGMVEADETFIGRNKAVKPRNKKKGLRGTAHKYAVLALVDRNTGMSRAIVPDDLKADTIGKFVRENVSDEAILMTDEFRSYRAVGNELAGHKRVRHAMGEYVNRKDRTIHTNTSKATSPSSSAA